MINVAENINNIITIIDKTLYTYFTSLPYQFLLPLFLAAANLTYAFIKINIGDVVSRREGYYHLYDTCYGLIIWTVFLCIFMSIGYITYTLGKAFGLNLPSEVKTLTIQLNGNTVVEYIDKHVLNVFNLLWSKLTTILSTLYSTITILNVIPLTTSLGITLSLGTQYPQFWLQFALGETVLLKLIAVVSKYIILFSALGLALCIIPQTRTWGSIIVSMCLVFPITSILMAQYVNQFILPNLPNIIQPSLDVERLVSNITNVVSSIIFSAYDIGKIIQEFCIYTAISSSIATASIFGISRVIDRIGHLIQL